MNKKECLDMFESLYRANKVTHIRTKKGMLRDSIHPGLCESDLKLFGITKRELKDAVEFGILEKHKFSQGAGHLNIYTFTGIQCPQKELWKAWLAGDYSLKQCYKFLESVVIIKGKNNA